MFVRRYAKALLDLSVADHDEAGVKKDADKLLSAFSEPKVLDFIKDRMIPRMKRIGMFEVSPLTAAFLMLVLKNNREEELPLILKEYERLFNEKNKLGEAMIVSRIEMSPSQKLKLTENLENKYDKKIKTTYKIDPSLLGGIYVKLDDKMLDGTVSGRLKEMSHRLLEA